ncbi:MAG: M48 family metallopeptidase [Alphaproteobacteria bacterium]
MCTCGPTRRSLLRLAGVGTVSVVVTGCDQIAGINLVSDETVEAMGLRAWEELRGTLPVSRNPAAQQTADRVAARLLAAAGENRGDWEVVVFANPAVNAFALPGRKIGIFEGMFRIAQNDDQLAAIIGHEIGHLQAEHGRERMNAQVAKGWGLQIVALLLNLSGVGYGPEIAAALGLGVEYGLVLPYSRRHEFEADRLGLQLTAQAGFRPEEAITLWQRMDAAAGPRLPQFLATHPAPEARIKAIREILAGQTTG